MKIGQHRTHFTFKDNGSFHVEIADRTQDTTEERVGSANIAGNWADFPEFGEYDDLCKVERIALEDDFVTDKDVNS